MSIQDIGNIGQLIGAIATVATLVYLADLTLRGLGEPAKLSPVERVRIHGLLIMSFRRLEAVYVQCNLGSIDAEMMVGFERSLLPMLKAPLGAQWWSTAQQTFHKSFVAHVNKRLSSGDISTVLLSMPNATLDRSMPFRVVVHSF